MDLHTWLDAEKGRASALAQHLNVSKTAVSLWRENGVPMPHMLGVVEFTAGAVTVAEMAEHAIACRAAQKSAAPPIPSQQPMEVRDAA